MKKQLLLSLTLSVAALSGSASAFSDSPEAATTYLQTGQFLLITDL